MMQRELFILPKHVDTMDMREVMSWATNEVLRLDTENQRLREKVREYEERDELQARAKVPASRAANRR